MMDAADDSSTAVLDDVTIPIKYARNAHDLRPDQFNSLMRASVAIIILPMRNIVKEAQDQGDVVTTSALKALQISFHATINHFNGIDNYDVLTAANIISNGIETGKGIIDPQTAIQQALHAKSNPTTAAALGGLFVPKPVVEVTESKESVAHRQREIDAYAAAENSKGRVCLTLPAVANTRTHHSAVDVRFDANSIEVADKILKIAGWQKLTPEQTAHLNGKLGRGQLTTTTRTIEVSPITLAFLKDGPRQHTN